MSPLIALVSLPLVIDLGVKSLVVMLVCCVVAACLGRSSAARRHLVWTLGVLSLLALPVLSLALPAWQVAWLPGWLATSRSESRTAATTTIATAGTVMTPPLDHVIPRNGAVAQTPADADSVPAADVAPATRYIADQSVARVWPMLIAAGWLAGAVLAALPLAVGLWQLRRLRRGSTPIRSSDWLAVLAELRGQLRVWQSVRLQQSPAATMPLTWGAIRPVLLLPAEADEWAGSRRKMVLWHELAHIRRQDWLTQMLANVACAIYWFNPLVWLAARQMRIERERACDDLVLACGAKPSDYAGELLALAAGLADPRMATLAAVPMARRSLLEGRLQAIVDRSRSRAALTAVAAVVGGLIAAAAIAPVAMLRAAQPKEEPPVTSPKPTESDKPKLVEPRTSTAEEIAARANGIRITVLNSTGDKGIAEFRVIAGVPARGTADEYEKRTGRTVVNWQPHTVKIGKDGDYTWPLDKAYDEMAIRIEADGYEPQIWAWAKKADGVQHIVFQLREDKGVAGRVFTPEGKPAAGATIALALVQKDAVLEGGKLRGSEATAAEIAAMKPGDRWRRPLFVKSDAEGRFTLPTEFEPAAVLVIHESGVRELAYDDWKKSPEIKLDGWGKIEGRVLWGEKAGAGEEVSLSIHRDEYGYPGMVASYDSTQSDDAGRFVFDRVLPGRAQLSRPIRPAEPSKAGFTAINLDGMNAHITVKAGEPTPAIIGGQGRTVKGKLVGLESWKDVTFHFHPNAPHIGFPGDDEIWKAFGQLQASDIGPILFRDKQPVKDDGTFEIKGVLPGTYQLFVSAPGKPGQAGYTRFTLEPEVPGQEPAAQDIGTIEVKQPGVPMGAAKPPAAVKPTAESPTPPSKPVRIRGKAIDVETGKPIERLIVQAGKFDPADPTKVTWGFSESRSDGRDGTFSATVRWGEGWTARVLADGYISQPVITARPPGDKDTIDVTLRMIRGRHVSGVVLDHTGKPVKGAAVFAIGPTHLNLAAGRAWTTWGEPDDNPKPVTTDDAGKFELPAGEAKRVAVSHSSLDAWPAAIPAEGPVKITLPEPARVEVTMDIEGADKDARVFYQLLTQGVEEFVGLQSTRETKIASGGKLTLAALPPGRYQFCRMVTNRLREFGSQPMLERQFIELKSGETTKINWVRDRGARVRGKVTWPADRALDGVIVSIRAEQDVKDPFDGHDWRTVYASHVAATDGTFLTERIAPGSYLARAEAYEPRKPEDRARLGHTAPSLVGELKIEVPAEGELKLPDLPLVEVQR